MFTPKIIFVKSPTGQRNCRLCQIHLDRRRPLDQPWRCPKTPHPWTTFSSFGRTTCGLRLPWRVTGNISSFLFNLSDCIMFLLYFILSSYANYYYEGTFFLLLHYHCTDTRSRTTTAPVVTVLHGNKSLR